MIVYLDERAGGDRLYVDHEEVGTLYRVEEDGERVEVHHLPEHAVELTHPDELRGTVLDEVREALAGVGMSKTARTGVAKVLDALDGAS